MVAAAAPSMNSSAPGLGKSTAGMDLLAVLDVVRGRWSSCGARYDEQNQFQVFSVIGTELSHLADFRDWSFEGRSSSSRRIAARLVFGENRRTTIWWSRRASTTLPFTAIYVKVASNVDRGPIRRDEVGFERRPARVLGPFQGQMSNRVAEEGLKTPIKPAKRAAGVERMTVSRGVLGTPLLPLLLTQSPETEDNRCRRQYFANTNHNLSLSVKPQLIHPLPEGPFLTLTIYHQVAFTVFTTVLLLLRYCLYCVTDPPPKRYGPCPPIRSVPTNTRGRSSADDKIVERRRWHRELRRSSPRGGPVRVHVRIPCFV